MNCYFFRGPDRRAYRPESVRFSQERFRVARINSTSNQHTTVVERDEAFAEETPLPRAVKSSRMLRGGIAVGAAAVVGLLAIVTPGIAHSALAAAAPTPTATAIAAEELRPGTTDAFVSRSVSRTEAPAADVEDAATQRANALAQIGDQVAEAQTSAAAEARNATLGVTTTAIDTEAKRVASIKFVWPTAGSITSPWGMRLHPILGYVRLHAGVDIGGETGAPIFAVADGVVTKTAMGYNGGSGNNVRINHGTIDGQATESGYLHMNDIEVQEGQKVKKGQRIGTVGNTGLSTAPHLHFSMYINGANVDPAPYIKQ